MIAEFIEIHDVYKAALSLVAGFILGYEREMKDKAAGLKTITIICLGSTLFTILSYKYSGSGDPTRIASYIVSGVGFLGAGVIFKEGFTVYGLTTAGIIWISAAIGMSIGFGEALLAFVFLIFALLIIYSSKLLNRFILPNHSSRMLRFEIPADCAEERFQVMQDLSRLSKSIKEVNMERNNDALIINAELYLNDKKITQLENYLLKSPYIRSFSL